MDYCLLLRTKEYCSINTLYPPETEYAVKEIGLGKFQLTNGAARTSCTEQWRYQEFMLDAGAKDDTTVEIATRAGEWNMPRSILDLKST